jgi:alpha-tubulin suppressor-like RCC1 family protein
MSVLSNLTSLSVGEASVCALMNNGEVGCWGSNGTGQIGDGTTTNRSYPVKVVKGASAASIKGVGLAAGVTASHSCAVTSEGKVNCWGINTSGQLGDGTVTSPRLTPVKVKDTAGASDLTDIAKVVTGLSHSCALSSSGSVYCWGSNSVGQLGNGTIVSSNVPVPATSINTAIDLVAGDYHTCALLAKELTDGGGNGLGRIQCWGKNDSGQLGNNDMPNNSSSAKGVKVAAGTYLDDVAALSSGSSHVCALLSGGTAKCWGKNDSGQLGNNSTATAQMAVSVSGLAGATSVAAGATHSCASLANGNVMCWGDNASGQLGDGTTNPSLTPVGVGAISGVVSVSAGASFSCARLASLGAKCWGANANGQLGDGTGSQQNSPVSVKDIPGSGSLSNVMSIVTGDMRACALISDGSINCWGANAGGQIGNGNTTPSTLPVATTALQ